MGFTDQGTSTPSRPPVMLGVEDLSVERVIRPAVGARVNWLFSGVMLGAASWMLVLGAVFAAIGNWTIAGVMLCGIALCGLAIWRAGRRLTSTQPPGRHRAERGSALG